MRCTLGGKTKRLTFLGYILLLEAWRYIINLSKFRIGVRSKYPQSPQLKSFSIWYISVERQKGTITIQRCSIENQKGAITINMTAIAAFWVKTEHLWILIAPFWLSTDDIVVFNTKLWKQLYNTNYSNEVESISIQLQVYLPQFILHFKFAAITSRSFICKSENLRIGSIYSVSDLAMVMRTFGMGSSSSLSKLGRKSAAKAEGSSAWSWSNLWHRWQYLQARYQM